MKWTIEPHTTLDKRFQVTGPDDLVLYVDFDDVNHEEVDQQVTEMVATLNAETECLHCHVPRDKCEPGGRFYDICPFRLEPGQGHEWIRRVP